MKQQTDGFQEWHDSLSELARTEFMAWFNTRPDSVQALIRAYPPTRGLIIDGKLHYVLGYNEDDTLILSQVHPARDYDGAMANKVYVHRKCLEGAKP